MVVSRSCHMKTTEIQVLLMKNLSAILLLGVVVALSTGCETQPPDNSLKPVVRYSYPLTSPGTQFAECPPAVQRTIRAETGGAQIADIEKGSNDYLSVYKVLFGNSALFPPLYVASDGSVLNPDLSVKIPAPHEPAAIKTGGPVERVTLQDLPPQVVKAIQTEAPDAEVSSIVRETGRDKVVYVVTFKDQKHPVVFLAPDGTLLRESRL